MFTPIRKIARALRVPTAAEREMNYLNGARDLVDRMALVMQASLLVRHAPAFVADAFCASRLAGTGQHNFGALDRRADCAAIIARATPRA